MPHLFGVNLVATVAGAIAIMAVGFAWYGPLFGKVFLSLAGLSKKDLEGGPGLSPLYGLLNALVTSFMLAFFLSKLGTDDVWSGLTTAFLLWFGLSATTQVLPWIWEKQHITLTLLHLSNQCVGILLAALVISFF